jgi:histidyl-tRNA synthetase
VSVLLGRDLVSVSRSVPSAVLVAVTDEEQRAASEAVATSLRARGIPCEVAPKADKFGKQIRHADRRGIPFVWFPEAGGDSVKDIRSGDQAPADSSTWNPSAADLHPTVMTVAQEESP